MKLSVIIPCYNAADTIGAQLEALVGQHWSEPWEVIVANNRSTDESLSIVELYREKLPNLRVVDACERQGQPYALNTGAQAAHGEALAFCDADDQVGSGWLAAIGDALSRYDLVACRIDSEKLNAPWVRGIHGNSQQDGPQMIWYPPYLPHAGGGTVGVKRWLHDAVGGFDESLPYLHDTDYCFKAQLKGTTLHFVPDAIVHVRYRDHFSGIYRQARMWAEYNLIVYKKYRGAVLTNDLVQKYQINVKNFRPWKRYLMDWRRLLLRLRYFHHREVRAGCAKLFGWQIGRLVGSIKHHVPPV